MNVKIEISCSQRIKNLQANAQKVLDVIPAEHLRGFNRIVFLDVVLEPRLSASQRETLPALYHPRMGGQMAWAEVAMSVLLPKKKFPQNILARLTRKSAIAQAVLYLIAQHYHLTLSKGIKKTQLEPACRQYVEKYFDKWREKEGGLRVRLLKPFRPFLDKLARKLAKKYRAEMEKSKSK
jgi:hypothetical protein